MRLLRLLIVTGAWAAAAHAQPATPASRPDSRHAGIRPPAVTASAPTERRPESAAPAIPRGRHAHAEGGADVGRARKPSTKAAGILALRTTDITGNKELPKVMVIVPWRSPADAGAVIAPADSLLSEVLGPVDRGVFQRRIRYYGQLNGSRASPSAARPNAAAAGRERTR